MGYLIKKNDKTNEIVYINYDMDGYVFHPKKERNILQVNSITVINPSLIDKILTIKFNQLFKKIAVIAINVINDDDSDESSTRIVLDELEQLRAIVLHKYQKFLSDEKEKIFLEKIDYLTKMLIVKSEIYNYSRRPVEQRIGGRRR